jgi:hypothetical protein
MLPEELQRATGRNRTRKDVLNEDEVVRFVGDYFISREFVDVVTNLTNSTGIDVTASDPVTGEKWLVECKGEIKTKLNADGTQSPPFSPGMCRQSIEAALFKTMDCQSTAMKNADVRVRVGMAFPNTPHYRDYIGRIARSLEAANISVFLVSVQGVVKEY